MATGDLPTPMSSQSSRASQAGEPLSSSPCPMPSKGADKRRGKPTITPRSFGRFFAPKHASRSTSSRTTARHALSDASASRINLRAHKQSLTKYDGSTQIFDDEENPVWGSNNLSKRYRALASPETSPEKDSVPRPSKRAKVKHQRSGSSEQFPEEIDDRPAFKLRIRPALSVVNRSTFRCALGNIARRELGNVTNSYCRVVGDFSQDWRSQVSAFYSGAEDVYVNRSTTDEDQYVLPFCAAACHTNSLVAIGDEDGYIKLLETKRSGDNKFQKPFHSFRAHTNALIDLDFTCDDSLLATGSGDQTGRVIDMRTQQCIFQLREHRSSIKQIRFQPTSGNSVLATSGREGTVLLWDLRFKDSRGALNTASVQLDGDPPTGSDDMPHTSRMKSAAFVKCIPYAHATLTAHHNSIAGPVTPIVDEKYTRRRERQQHQRKGISVTALSFLPNSSHLLLTGSEADATVRVWDLRSRQHNGHRQSLPVASTERPTSHQRHRDFGLTSMTLNADGSQLYTLCKDHTVYAYSTSHLILGRAPEYGQNFRPSFGEEPKIGLGPSYGFRHPRLKASTFYVKAAFRPAFNDHQELLAVGGTDKCAVLFPTDANFLRRQQLKPIRKTGHLEALAYTPRTSTFNSPGSSLAAPELHETNGFPIYTIGAALERGHESEVTGLSWTSEGELVTVGDDTRCRVWREDAEKARRLQVHGEGGGERWLQGWAEVSPLDSDDEE